MLFFYSCAVRVWSVGTVGRYLSRYNSKYLCVVSASAAEMIICCAMISSKKPSALAVVRRQEESNYNTLRVINSYRAMNRRIQLLSNDYE